MTEHKIPNTIYRHKVMFSILFLDHIVHIFNKFPKAKNKFDILRQHF